SARGLVTDAIARMCLRLWHMPRENWVDVHEYRTQLERHGFAVEFIKPIGDKVFPGFASFNVRRDSILNTVRVRGMPIGLGLVFISWLLGYAYNKGLSDYLIVKAVKFA